MSMLSGMDCVTSFTCPPGTGTGMHHGLVDDYGMKPEVAQCIVLMKCSPMESTEEIFDRQNSLTVRKLPCEHGLLPS
jgi:hypothetical protein